MRNVHIVYFWDTLYISGYRHWRSITFIYFTQKKHWNNRRKLDLKVLKFIGDKRPNPPRVDLAGLFLWVRPSSVKNARRNLDRFSSLSKYKSGHNWVLRKCSTWPFPVNPLQPSSESPTKTGIRRIRSKKNQLLRMLEVI